MSNLDQAVCRQPGINPDDWFRGPDTPRGRRALRACLSCPLKANCRAYALEQGLPYGIWGGTTPEYRRKWWADHGGMPDLFYADIDRALRQVA